MTGRSSAAGIRVSFDVGCSPLSVSGQAAPPSLSPNPNPPSVGGGPKAAALHLFPLAVPEHGGTRELHKPTDLEATAAVNHPTVLLITEAHLTLCFSVGTQSGENVGHLGFYGADWHETMEDKW